MLDCINIFTSDVFNLLIHGDVNKNAFCNLVMFAVFEAQFGSYVNKAAISVYMMYNNCNYFR